jgi:hypothetical protein
MLCNSFIAIDVRPWHTRADGRSDDLDTVVEWVYETMTNESLWWTEEAPGEEEDSSAPAAKWYKWLVHPQDQVVCLRGASEQLMGYRRPQNETSLAPGLAAVLQPPPNVVSALF